jgi:hypothetical protein
MTLKAGPPESRRRRAGRPSWWVLVAAAAVLAVAAAVLVIVLRDGDDSESTPGSAPATSASGPPTSAPPTTSTAQSTSTPPTRSAPPSTTAPAGRTSPLDVFGTCNGSSCPDVQYAADGLAVAYQPESKTITVLEATPRTVTLDIAESQGRLLAIGPDKVAYLLVESAEAPNPGRILAVATDAGQAGTAHEVVGPTDGLGSVVVVPSADGIDVVDCCGVGVPGGHYPYVDAHGAELPGDPSRAAWSWEWPVSGRMIVRNNATGQDFEVPQPIPEREGPRSGDLRPLLDGRVAVIIDDDTGASTVWILVPDRGTWTSTELGNVLVEAIDPAGAVLTRNPSTLAYNLVPLG